MYVPGDNIMDYKLYTNLARWLKIHTIVSFFQPQDDGVRGYILYPPLGKLSLYSLYIHSTYCVYAAHPILHLSSLYHLSSQPLLSGDTLQTLFPS